MNKYIDLWNKKNKYVSKLEIKLAEVKEEQRNLDHEERKLNETRIISERELHKLERYDEENTKKAILILEMILVGVLSLFSIPLLTHFNLSVLISALLIIGVNVINTGGVAITKKILAKYYQELREQNKAAIYIEKLTISNTNKKMQDNYMAREEARKKGTELLLEMEQEKQEIKKIGMAILNALTECSEEDLGLKSEVLNEYIEKEIFQEEKNMTRERTLDK